MEGAALYIYCLTKAIRIDRYTPDSRLVTTKLTHLQYLQSFQAPHLIYGLPVGPGGGHHAGVQRAKICNCEEALGSSLDAIQVMGGDGLTSCYPLPAILQCFQVGKHRGENHGGLHVCDPENGHETGGGRDQNA